MTATTPIPRGWDMRFEVFAAGSGGYYFRLVAANGETVAQSERYEQKASAQQTVAAIQAQAGTAQVVDLT